MLAIAFGGREAAARIRARAAQVRVGSGVLVAAVAAALVFHQEERLTKLRIPGLSGLENRIAHSHGGQSELAKVRGGRAQLAVVQKRTGGLPDYGVAPPLHAGGVWINTKPFTLEQQRGKVVLIDFWTYSCINCLRTLPHLESWYARYHRQGLVIVGVHTPDFAFEHVASNVRAAVKRLGIKYPVVQDNRYKTWDNYANQYWPAEYLIDKTGHLRHTHFGEGKYDETESLIRRLLGASGARAAAEADTTPTGLMTPETYLGYSRLANYVGTAISPDVDANYKLPSDLPRNTLDYGGRWRIGAERIAALQNASLRLHFHARDVYIVLGGHGTVRAFVDGKPTRTLSVDAQRLYTVRASNRTADATLELRFSPGIEAYSFTFG